MQEYREQQEQEQEQAQVQVQVETQELTETPTDSGRYSSEARQAEPQRVVPDTWLPLAALHSSFLWIALDS